MISQDTRDKMRKAKQGYIPWNKGKKCPQLSVALKGRKLTQEHKDNIIKGHLGIKFSIDHKNKMAKAHTGLKTALGYKHTEDAKRKLREITIKRIENGLKSGNSMEPTIGKYEASILDYIQNECLNYTILRQYKVNGYFLDGYCPSLNLAIEVDEPRHNTLEYQRDSQRQIEIENSLNCQFMRIKI